MMQSGLLTGEKRNPRAAHRRPERHVADADRRGRARRLAASFQAKCVWTCNRSNCPISFQRASRHHPAGGRRQKASVGRHCWILGHSGVRGSRAVFRQILVESAVQRREIYFAGRSGAGAPRAGKLPTWRSPSLTMASASCRVSSIRVRPLPPGGCGHRPARIAASASGSRLLDAPQVGCKEGVFLPSARAGKGSTFRSDLPVRVVQSALRSSRTNIRRRHARQPTSPCRARGRSNPCGR